jgi:hypothetical protein
MANYKVVDGHNEILFSCVPKHFLEHPKLSIRDRTGQLLIENPQFKPVHVKGMSDPDLAVLVSRVPTGVLPHPYSINTQARDTTVTICACRNGLWAHHPSKEPLTLKDNDVEQKHFCTTTNGDCGLPLLDSNHGAVGMHFAAESNEGPNVFVPFNWSILRGVLECRGTG